MAQTGFTPIQLYSSSTPTNAPSAGNLTNDTKGSELAINIADKNLFFKDSGGVVNTVPIRQSSTSSNGWLSSTDWNTFNSKQAALVSGVNIKTVNGTSLLGAGDLGTITTAYGGTGLASYTQGDLLYYNSGTTLTALPKNTTATRYLANTGTNNNPAWAQINLTNGVTGALPVPNGGTGGTSFTTGLLIFGNGTSGFLNGGHLFWDNSGKRLGVGTASPSTYDATLAVVGNIATVNTGSKHYLYYISATNHAAVSSSAGGDITFITGLSSPTTRQTIFASGGVSIGNTTDPGATNLSVTGLVSAARFVPTGSTIPTNGMYLPAANTVAWATNSTQRAQIASTGIFLIGTTSGISNELLNVNGTAITQSFSSNGNGAINTVLDSQGRGGGLCIIRGSDGFSGQSFSRTYTVSITVPGGAASTLATLIGSAGGASTTGFAFAFATSGGFVTVTASGFSGFGGQWHVSFIGL